MNDPKTVKCDFGCKDQESAYKLQDMLTKLITDKAMAAMLVDSALITFTSIENKVKDKVLENRTLVNCPE